MRKITAAAIIFSLLAIAFSGDLLARTRKLGVQLIIVKKDGKVLRGELIAVKPASILTMEEVSDESIDVKDIKYIKIVSTKEFLRGSGIGFLIGSISGALIGAAGKNTTGTDLGAISVCSGILGEVLLGVIGAKAGVIETIQIEGKSPEDIKKALEKLNRLARIPQKLSL